MKKALLCVSGLQYRYAPYAKKVVGYKDYIDNWKTNILDVNTDYEWSTIFSFDSKAISEKEMFFGHSYDSPSWDEIYEDIFNYRGAPFHITSLINYDPYPAVKPLNKMYSGSKPEIGPLIFFARNKFNFDCVDPSQFDKIVIIRPDATISGPCVLDDIEDVIFLEDHRGGGGWFHNKDWDMGIAGDANIIHQWVEHGYKLLSGAKVLCERNEKSMHLVSSKQDDRQLWTDSADVVEIWENYLYSFEHIDKLRSSSDLNLSVIARVA